MCQQFVTYSYFSSALHYYLAGFYQGQVKHLELHGEGRGTNTVMLHHRTRLGHFGSEANVQLFYTQTVGRDEIGLCSNQLRGSGYCSCYTVFTKAAAAIQQPISRSQTLSLMKRLPTMLKTVMKQLIESYTKLNPINTYSKQLYNWTKEKALSYS